MKRRFFASASVFMVAVLLGSIPTRQAAADGLWGPAPSTANGAYAPQNGDIIFQISRSPQSAAIKEVTGSPYSHMGIVYHDDGAWKVFEASGTVTLTPLADWISSGEQQHYVVKRWKHAVILLDQDKLARMLEEGKALAGKDYDECFEWSDQEIYCSELVWKIYDRALNLRIGEPQPLSDFDLSTATVAAILKKRPHCRMAADEMVISPAAMFHSDLLVTVHEEN